MLSVGTASLPAIGGSLATFGWFYPFALPVLAIPIGIFVIFSLRNPDPRNEQGLKDYFGSVWRHLRDREVVGLLGVSLLTFVILFGPRLSYLPIMMNDRFGAPSYVIGGVLSGASFTTALVSSQLGRLAGRFSEKTLLQLLVPLALFGVAQGINLPNVFSLLNSHVPNENRGAFMATNGMALRTGQTVGPLLMASPTSTHLATGAYLATAAIAPLAFFLAVVPVR